MKVTNKHHDLISLTVIDKGELILPESEILRVHDSETGRESVIDTRDSRLRSEYESKAKAVLASREKLLRSVKVDSLNMFTGEPYVKELARFFKMRAVRKG